MGCWRWCAAPLSVDFVRFSLDKAPFANLNKHPSPDTLYCFSAMADEDKSDSNTSQQVKSPTSQQLVEVICTSSGKTRRFVQGVKAGFALTIINQKLIAGNPLALYVEAAKEGEEPIVFAPDSLLRSCGDGWKLHTVVESRGHHKGTGVQGLKGKTTEPVTSFTYIGKIILAFIFIFLLGAVFTLALESLPRLILFITSAYRILYSE